MFGLSRAEGEHLTGQTASTGQAALFRGGTEMGHGDVDDCVEGVRERRGIARGSYQRVAQGAARRNNARDAARRRTVETGSATFREHGLREQSVRGADRPDGNRRGRVELAPRSCSSRANLLGLAQRYGHTSMWALVTCRKRGFVGILDRC